MSGPRAPIPIFGNPSIPPFLFCLACVTAFFTYSGANTAISAGTVDWLSNMGAVIYAIGSSICIYAIWTGLPILVAKAETIKERIAVSFLILISTVMILGLSSWLNVVAIAGDSAVNSHMNAQIVPFEVRLDQQRKTLVRLKGFETDFSSSATLYLTRQESEITRGAYTGVPGTGTVEQTLGTMAVRFDTHGKNLSAVVITLLADADHLKGLLGKLRDAVNGPGDPAIRLHQFAQTAIALREGLSAMDATPLVDSLKRGLAGLPGEARIQAVSAKTEAGAAKQRAALDRVANETQETVDTIVRDLDRLLEDNDAEIPGFVPVDPIKAVLLYPLDHAPFWVGGIAMDVTPMLLLVCSMVIMAIRGRRGIFIDRVGDLTVRELMEASYGREAAKTSLVDLGIVTDVHDDMAGRPHDMDVLLPPKPKADPSDEDD